MEGMDDFLTECLAECLDALDRDCGLSGVAPELFEAVSRHVLAPGKRLRPKLLLLSYGGYAERFDPGIWKTAAALEMFHAFALIHDDIVDDSVVRRGRPAMHVVLAGSPGGQYRQDVGRKLALLAGDVLFSMAMRTFLACGGEAHRVHAALELLTLTAARTGAGVFSETLVRARPFEGVSRRQILTIHGLKSAEYSFACPLQVGAILGGADPEELSPLGQYGRLLGSSFQMQDDVDDMEEFCMSATDVDGAALAETRLTIPMWWAWQEATEAERGWLSGLYRKGHAARGDLVVLRRILDRTEAIERTREEVADLAAAADRATAGLAMRPDALAVLRQYAGELLPAGAAPVERTA